MHASMPCRRPGREPWRRRYASPARHRARATTAFPTRATRVSSFTRPVHEPGSAISAGSRARVVAAAHPASTRDRPAHAPS